MKNISFEVFPPKKEDNFPRAYEVITELSEMKPDFISVTYGAGGSKSKNTLDIADFIVNKLGSNAMVHLTCVGSTREQIDNLCQEYQKRNIKNVLALRGDRPLDMDDDTFSKREFTYALDLINYLKENTMLNIWAACYPEVHPEATGKQADLEVLREKNQAGVGDFITQLFFDNSVYYRFVEDLSAIGVSANIHAGIMPITSSSQIGTTVKLSGSRVPEKLESIIAKYGDNKDDMYKAGIEYATKQIEDLISKKASVHIYTMNNPAVARDILNNLG